MFADDGMYEDAGVDMVYESVFYIMRGIVPVSRVNGIVVAFRQP
jgi:hypothetical protein